MKVAYFGECDYLTTDILQRLRKEDYDVYVLSSDVVAKKDSRWKGYHHYRLTEKKEDAKRIFEAVNPDIVIYEGTGYLKEVWDLEQRENFSYLSLMLEACANLEACRFVFLSSLEVYGKGGETERNIENPQSLKGRWMLQEENFVQSYNQQEGIQTTILRLGPVFANDMELDGNDIWGNICQGILHTTNRLEIKEQTLQPIHALDVADAVVRIIEREETNIYNVCGSRSVKKSEIVKLLIKKWNHDTDGNIDLDFHFDTEGTGNIQNNSCIGNGKIKEELEWTDLWSLEDTLQNHIIFHELCEDRRKKKEKKQGKGSKNRLRRIIENLVLFVLFACFFLLTKDHTLFSKVDWLLIYVVLIALGYGVKQGAFAVVLSSALYLMAQGNSLWEMTNFYSYAECVLMMVEFIFFGIVVGYVADMLKEAHRNDQLELERIANSYENLKEINDKNVLLKNEYEKRVLDAKTSLPKLYSIVQRINVLDSNRIFMEVLTVIKELIKTDTVAVYRVSANSSYLRLMASLNKESALGGNSWNLKEYPKMEQAIRNNQIYEGNVFEQEPAIVLPISSKKGCEAAIVIKELPMEACSRYSVNLLRTLLALTSDSLEKALQYDNALHESKYWKNTNILNPMEFQKAIQLEEEKIQRGIADSCILKICGSDGIAETYQRVEKMFREIDIWGMDDNENLYVLLGNTTEENAEYVMDRLQKIGIQAEKILNFGNGCRNPIEQKC